MKNIETSKKLDISSVKERYMNRLMIPVHESDDFIFKTLSGLQVAIGYNSIVIGLRGPYIEFSKEFIIKDSFHIPDDQRWRIGNKSVYYVEYRSNCNSNVKIYHQKRLVDYADYKIGMYYISPFDLTDEGGRKVIV